jgi:hypothetical protein
MSKSPDTKNTLYCSFCGKSQHEVRKFDRGCEAARAYRGPVTSLINGKNVTANDETFALAA